MGLFRRKKPTKEDEGWKYYKMALDEKGRNTRLEPEYTQKAIGLGERHAMCHLASYYLDHCSTDKEKVREATQLMEQAESMGALLECRRIGYAYALQGLYDKAFPRYLKGAEEGDSFCQFCTGLYYKNGQGVEQDYAKAIYWYEKAVENKEVLAFNNLGLMYKDGLGVEKDNTKALELLKMGSELGNHTPSGNLAFDYYKGEDPCPQDYEKARHYAELGLSQSKGKNKNCRYVLAMLECDGLAGIPCNPCSAYDKVQQLAREEYKPALDGGVGYCLIKRSDWVKARRQEARNMMADRPEEAIAILQELRDLGFWQVEKDIEAYENMKARERALEQDDMYKKALEANDVNAIRQAAEHGSPMACADMLDRYMKDLEYKSIDTLILGCTHYPLLRSVFRKVAGEDVVLVNPAYETARELGQLLEEHRLRCDSDVESAGTKYEFFVSDAAEKFCDFANSILPYDIEQVQQINIEGYD